MSIFKCKMCGGNLEVTGESSVVTCEYCGTSQTISKSRDEVVSNLYNRANDLRIKCEFDRAEQTYEKILEQDNTEAEAHWGIVLCRYGIEYVDDPATSKKIPTCHRTSYEAITSDADYIAAIQNADSEQKAVYEAEAKAIDEIQKNILSIVKNEDPFDVFICYKETDANGKRTVDSTIANDIYYQLTQEGFKVFYAPITLEDKLGQEYEPYIFAALNSAKVMLVVGTKPEYFNAVWVKNEWSRYLKFLKTDRSKMIIPCYRDMDAYDLPDEFAHLQSQDMSKIGFVNDVVRGIKKIINVETSVSQNNVAVKSISQTVVEKQSNKQNLEKTLNIQLLKRKTLRIILIVIGALFIIRGIYQCLDIVTNVTINLVKANSVGESFGWLNYISLVLYHLAFILFGTAFLVQKKTPFLQLGFLFVIQYSLIWTRRIAAFRLGPDEVGFLIIVFVVAIVYSIIPSKYFGIKFKSIFTLISLLMFLVTFVTSTYDSWNILSSYYPIGDVIKFMVSDFFVAVNFMLAVIVLSIYLSFDVMNFLDKKIDSLKQQL